MLLFKFALVLDSLPQSETKDYEIKLDRNISNQKRLKAKA